VVAVHSHCTFRRAPGYRERLWTGRARPSTSRRPRPCEGAGALVAIHQHGQGMHGEGSREAEGAYLAGAPVSGSRGSTKHPAGQTTEEEDTELGRVMRRVGQRPRRLAERTQALALQGHPKPSKGALRRRRCRCRLQPQARSCARSPRLGCRSWQRGRQSRELCAPAQPAAHARRTTERAWAPAASAGTVAAASQGRGVSVRQPLAARSWACPAAGPGGGRLPAMRRSVCPQALQPATRGHARGQGQGQGQGQGLGLGLLP
jgi:hypothetical protein